MQCNFKFVLNKVFFFLSFFLISSIVEHALCLWKGYATIRQAGPMWVSPSLVIGIDIKHSQISMRPHEPSIVPLRQHGTSIRLGSWTLVGGATLNHLSYKSAP